MTKKPRTRGAKRPSIKKARPKTARPAAPSKVQHSKLDLMISALRAPKGATISDLMALTGWQMHSVRGAIAGTLKKKRGLTVLSAKTEGERIYRISGKP